MNLLMLEAITGRGFGDRKKCWNRCSCLWHWPFDLPGGYWLAENIKAGLIIIIKGGGKSHG